MRGMMIMKGEFERVWEGAVLVYISSCHLGGTGKAIKILKPVSWSNFNPHKCFPNSIKIQHCWLS